MTNKDHGGFAFPQGEKVGDIGQSTGGMTLRDYFAAKALHGLLGGKAIEAAASLKGDAISRIVVKSYECADLMLNERQK